MKNMTYLLVLLSSSAIAATSATLLLKGTIPQVLDVSTTPEAVAIALPLSTAQTNLKVGTLTQRSNSPTGYKIAISSANLGKLVRNSTNSIAYTLAYGGTAVNLTAPQVFTTPFTSAAPVSKDLNISYTDVDTTLMAGDYTDTLTFTISAN